MQISETLRLALAQKGVTTLFSHPFNLPDGAIFEPPCNLKRMQAVHSLELGAFSYAESGYYFGVKIGRYTSIGEAVQIGRGSHPITWGSTSPLFYGHHNHVFNQDIREAVGFQHNAPPQRSKATTIGNDCYIGYGALISQGVTVGDGAVISPFSVVTKDVPPYTIVAGNPAVMTGTRFPAKMVARMQNLAWWRFAFWDMPGAPVARPEAFLDHIEWCMEEGIKPYEPELIRLNDFAKAGV